MKTQITPELEVSIINHWNEKSKEELSTMTGLSKRQVAGIIGKYSGKITDSKGKILSRTRIDDNGYIPVTAKTLELGGFKFTKDALAKREQTNKKMKESLTGRKKKKTE